MGLESVKVALRDEITTLNRQAERVKKALAALEGETVRILPGIKQVSAGTREKIRQAALRRWADKKKAPPAGKGK